MGWVRGLSGRDDLGIIVWICLVSHHGWPPCMSGRNPSLMYWAAHLLDRNFLLVLEFSLIDTGTDAAVHRSL